MGTYSEALADLLPGALALLSGEGDTASLFHSPTQGYIAETPGNTGLARPLFLEILTQLLDWPYWEVRMKACRAPGKMTGPLPEKTLYRLLQLCNDPESQAVCTAAGELLQPRFPDQSQSREPDVF